MRKEGVLKVRRLERIWMALNIVGVVYYVAKNMVDSPNWWWPIGLDPRESVHTVLPVLASFFLLNLIWTVLVLVAILRRRRTPMTLLVILFVGILWTGTLFGVNCWINCGEEEAQK